MKHLERFPALSEKQYQQILRLPSGRARCVIDTDTRNEIDDQVALAWALLSRNQLDIEAIYAAPYSFTRRFEQAGWDINDRAKVDPQGLLMVEPGRGMDLSYDEILLVCEKLGIDFADKVFRGSERYLGDDWAPVTSDAAKHLVETAMSASAEEPLYVLAIGAPTNMASALLMAPEIIERIVVVWTAGYPTRVTNTAQDSFNMEQDVKASQLLFDSGVPLVYLPGFHVGAQLSVSLPEIEAWVKGAGAIGDYLHWLYTNNPLHAHRGIADHFGRTWIIWDLINFAWLMNPDWVPSYLIDAPYLSDDCKWYRQGARRHTIREGLDINRDAIFRDFFSKLAAAI